MILLTGATGFLGGRLLKKLLSRKDQFICFVRKSSNLAVIKEYGFEYTFGDLDDFNSLKEALTGKDTIINLASLGFGHAPNIIRACQGAGVKRGIFISTTAIFTTINAKSKKTRLEAEELIRNSGIKYTILRPTMIYGAEGDRNISRLIPYIKRHSIMPVFGSGQHLQQPIYVEDLIDAIIKCLYSPAAINKTYNLAGREPLTYNQLIDQIAEALDKKIYKLHIPFWLGLLLTRCYNKLFFNPKVTVEQVMRLAEDKAFSYKEAVEDFVFSPIPFSEGIKKEINQLRE